MKKSLFKGIVIVTMYIIKQQNKVYNIARLHVLYKIFCSMHKVICFLTIKLLQALGLKLGVSFSLLDREQGLSKLLFEILHCVILEQVHLKKKNKTTVKTFKMVKQESFPK